MKKKIKEYIGTKVADILFDGVFSEIQEDLKNNMQEQIIQQFQDKLDEQMLARYGNSDFYDDLCKAMIKNDNISILLKRCQNRSLLDDREDSEVIDGIMRGMNIRIYNYDNVKDAINYIVQQALVVFNELHDIENIKLKNIIMQQGDKTQKCFKAVQRMQDKIELDKSEIVDKLDQIIHQNELYFSKAPKSSVMNIGELKSSDVQMLESGKYKVKVSARKEEDYFKVLTDVKVNLREFQYNTFDEYIAYLRFAGESANLNVCSFTVIASDGTIIKKYEDESYTGIKIALPIVYIKEVELGNVEFTSMTVCIKPEFDYQDIQVETEDGDVLIPSRHYQIKRKIRDGKLCVFLVDQTKTGRLLVNYIISAEDVYYLKTRTTITITQRNQDSVSSNLEFYRLLKNLQNANKLVGRNINREQDVFITDGFNDITDVAFEYLNDKIRFYTQLLKLERQFNIHFDVPSTIEHEEIVNVDQITKLLDGEIVKSKVGELTIRPDEVDFVDTDAMEDLEKMKAAAMLFHYQKITVFDVEIPIKDYVRMVIFVKNIQLKTDGSLKMECFDSYVYNEKEANLTDNEILNNFANGRLIIKREC